MATPRTASTLIDSTLIDSQQACPPAPKDFRRYDGQQACPAAPPARLLAHLRNLSSLLASTRMVEAADTCAQAADALDAMAETIRTQARTIRLLTQDPDNPDNAAYL